MMTTKASRVSTVVLAVTLQRLLEDATRFWSVEEKLVLEALRLSKNELNDATNEKLAEYISDLRPEQLRGVLNNVKGKFHELLFAHAENVDGDDVAAHLFEATNHPGADVEFMVDGETIGQVQLKASLSVSYVAEHLKRYPGIEVRATEEVAERMPDVESSGFSNEELTRDVRETFEELEGDSLLENIGEGLATSALVGAAIAAGRAVKERRFSRDMLKSTLGEVAVAGVAGLIIDELLDNLV